MLRLGPLITIRSACNGLWVMQQCMMVYNTCAKFSNKSILHIISTLVVLVGPLVWWMVAPEGWGGTKGGGRKVKDKGLFLASSE